MKKPNEKQKELLKQCKLYNGNDTRGTFPNAIYEKWWSIERVFVHQMKIDHSLFHDFVLDYLPNVWSSQGSPYSAPEALEAAEAEYQDEYLRILPRV